MDGRWCFRKTISRNAYSFLKQHPELLLVLSACSTAGSQGSATHAANQRFFQFGARFSAKARGPSLASSLLKTSPEISDSIL